MLPVVLLVLDFDGTLTDRDTLDLLAHRFAPGSFEEAEAHLDAGEWTLHDVIRHEFEGMRVDEAAVLDVLRTEVRLRPGAAELVDFCRERFVDAVVVSSGFHEVIEPFLAWNGIFLPVVAHRAAFSREGTVLTFLERDVCGRCGEPCKRVALPALARGRSVAYAGDGYSDRCGAAAADLVFARASLAEHLRREGVAFTPFDDLYDVRTGLAAFLDPA
jgi:2-hydroxy-3-keto-5-methylthiopentenyl-1-phosphate phosphatase